MQNKIYCLAFLSGSALLVGSVFILRKWMRDKRHVKEKGKLRGVESWVRINHMILRDFSRKILKTIGCDPETAKIVADHLVDSNLLSVDSHGVVRLEQYAEQVEKKLCTPDGKPELRKTERKAWIVDGNGGFGITALKLGVEEVKGQKVDYP